MEKLRLVLTAEQLRSRWTGQISGLGGLSAYILVLRLIERTHLWWAWAIAGVLSLNMLEYLYENVMYTRAFTECAEAKLRTRGLLGIRECGWSQIQEISRRQRVGGADVLVTTTNGVRFRLGVPVDRVTMHDPYIDSKVRIYKTILA